MSDFAHFCLDPKQFLTTRHKPAQPQNFTTHRPLLIATQNFDHLYLFDIFIIWFWIVLMFIENNIAAVCLILWLFFLDIFEDFVSPVSAAQTVLQSACKKRKDMLQKTMQFILQVLTAPNAEPQQKDGALHMVVTN